MQTRGSAKPQVVITSLRKSEGLSQRTRTKIEWPEVSRSRGSGEFLIEFDIA
jgi:hypothetical protein